jgi:hypothetical protein
MSEAFFHARNLMSAPAFFLQMHTEGADYSPTIIILSLLIITGLVIWMSYYYWKQRRISLAKERYRIKSAKLIKNGRKYIRGGKEELQNK